MAAFTPQAYYEALASGPVPIRSLLDTFELPHTSSGRQKFRDANKAFNTQFAGIAQIQAIWITPEVPAGEIAKPVKAFKIEQIGEIPNVTEAENQ